MVISYPGFTRSSPRNVAVTGDSGPRNSFKLKGNWSRISIVQIFQDPIQRKVDTCCHRRQILEISGV